MTRIKLADEDIFWFPYTPKHISITIPQNQRGEDIRKQAEQLRKQILEDYEFRELHDRRFDGIKTIKELQEQVKELKGRLSLEEDSKTSYQEMYERDNKELQKYKQFAESVKEFGQEYFNTHVYPDEIYQKFKQLFEGLEK